MSKHQWNYIIFGALSLAFVYVYLNYSWSIWAWILLFILWFALVVYGSFAIRMNYHLNAINKLSVIENCVALTFDDGPTPFTNEVLDLLKTHNAKATFFCIGKQIDMYPDIFLRIVHEGHNIGNHTYSHDKNMGFKSTKDLIHEIERTNKAIMDCSGEKTKLFRPPFGVTNPRFKRALEETKMITIGWTIRSLDTVLSNKSRILNRIEKKISPGSIILLHDTSERSVQVVARLLKILDEMNYQCVRIEPHIKL